jgi:hypothetical protein
MKLKHTIQTNIKIDSSDLNDLVKEVYKRDYCFEADMETGHDDIIEITVEKGELGDYDAEKLKDFLRIGEHNRVASALMNDLCNRGYIIEGDYLVETL